jgi:RNA polymerase sigma-70 factor (ECF subfamily)
MQHLTLILQDEKDLFYRLSQNDKGAFTLIFDHYEPRIYPFLLRITKSETAAEEIVQEVFIKLWTLRAEADKIENPRSYIFRMATNKAVSHLRSLSKTTKLMQHVAGNTATARNITQENIDYKQTEDIINKLADQLPTQQQKVYKLSRQQGMSNEEIAGQLHISPSTVKNHLTEALRFIRERLQQSSTSIIFLVTFLVKFNK